MRKIIIYTLIILFFAGTSLCLAEEIKTEDKNNDSKPDIWTYYGDDNRPVKIEADRNYDSKIDLWINYGEKASRTTKIDLNFDGSPDMHSYYQYGQRVKLEIDSDYDGNLDQVNEYSNDRLVKMQRADKNHKLETVFDISGRNLPQTKHTEYYEANSDALDSSKILPEKQKAQ